jgi:hypothetical protein
VSCWRGTPPRYGTPRRAERPTHGALLAKIARLLGWELFPWQLDAADITQEYDAASGFPRYRTIGLSEARQNGKTTLVLCRIALQLIVPRSVVAYTAQDRNTARRKWQQYTNVLMATPFADRVRHVSRNNGTEGLQMHNGSEFLIVTPNEEAGRSMSLDLVVIDEAAQHTNMDVVGALGPTTLTKPRAQTWLLSNAGTFTSAAWRHYTDAGRASIDNPASTLCWLEWCADDDADVFDRVAWAAANPSLDLPGGASSTALLDAAMSLPADQFRREHLNLWVDVAAMTGIDPVAWAACRDDDTVPEDDLALSLDLTPERDHGTLVMAGDVNGRTAIEVVEHSHDLELLVMRAVDVASRWGATVVLDRGSPAASAVPALERAGVTVRMISLPDFVRACGSFYDSALRGRLSHRGDFRLKDAVAGATKRQVGDGWVWRRRGQADISPLVAATLAHWGVVAATEPLQAVVW